MQAPEFLTHLVRTALGRETPPQAVTEPRPAAEAAPAPTPVEANLDPGIAGVLGEKVLLAWLRNRYQLLFPFALDLRRLDRAQAELMVHAMIAAAQADGATDPKERQRIEGTLGLVNPDETEQDRKSVV